MDANEQTAAQEKLQIPKAGKLALASMVLGVMSFLGFGPLCSVPGVVLGHLARRANRLHPNEFCGPDRATTGLWLGYLNLVCFALFVSVLLPALQEAKAAARRAVCQGNLKQFGLGFERFAHDDSLARFPELSPTRGRLTFLNEVAGMNSVYPRYLNVLTPLACPWDTRALKAVDNASATPQDVIDRSSYIYLGYVVTNDRELRAFAEAYKKRLAQGKPFDTDLEVAPGEGTCGGNRIVRLREHCERSLNRDISNPTVAPIGQSSIPILWDTIPINADGKLDFRHEPSRANVLFMDGHVECLPYRQKFPVTEEACRILAELRTLTNAADGK